ncbi:MAG: hypothetical protein ACRD5H_16620 [Nitrososphaerales archaeon]
MVKHGMPVWVDRALLPQVNDPENSVIISLGRGLLKGLKLMIAKNSSVSDAQY